MVFLLVVDVYGCGCRCGCEREVVIGGFVEKREGGDGVGELGKLICVRADLFFSGFGVLISENGEG